MQDSMRSGKGLRDDGDELKGRDREGLTHTLTDTTHLEVAAETSMSSAQWKLTRSRQGAKQSKP